MDRIEYTYLVISPEDLEDKLNGKGRRGWDLVSCTPIVQEMQADTPQGPVKIDVFSYHCVLKKASGEHPESEDG